MLRWQVCSSGHQARHVSAAPRRGLMLCTQQVFGPSGACSISSSTLCCNVGSCRERCCVLVTTWRVMHVGRCSQASACASDSSMHQIQNFVSVQRLRTLAWDPGCCSGRSTIVCWWLCLEEVRGAVLAVAVQCYILSMHECSKYIIPHACMQRYIARKHRRR